MIEVTSSHPPTTARAATDYRWLRVIDRLSLVLAAVGGLAVLIMGGNVVVSVVSRYFFGDPMAASLEIVQFWLMPLLAVLPLGGAVLRNEHITASALADIASPFARRIVKVVALVVTLVTTVILTGYVYREAFDMMAINESAVGTQWLPVWPIRFAVVVGLAGFALQVLAELVRTMGGRSGDPVGAGSSEARG